MALVNNDFDLRFGNARPISGRRRVRISKLQIKNQKSKTMNTFHQLLKPRLRRRDDARLCWGSAPATARGHPGSGIVVDWGAGVFRRYRAWCLEIDAQGQVIPRGPAYHFLAIDPDAQLARTRWPVFHEPSTDIRRVGADPMLLVSSDFPLRAPSVVTDRSGCERRYSFARASAPASGDRREWTPRVRRLSRRLGVDSPWNARATEVRGRSALWTVRWHNWGNEIAVGGVGLLEKPGGQFRTGSPSVEIGRRADEVQVAVTPSKGFWTGK